MSEVRTLRLRVSLFAMAASLAFAVALPSALLALAAVVAGAATWWITGGGSSRRLPAVPTAVLAAIVVLAALAVWAASAPGPGAPALLGVVVLSLALIRLMGRRTLADERNVLMAGGVLIVIAALESNDLLVGMLILAACALAIDAAIRYQVATVAAEGPGLAEAGHGWFGASSAAAGESPGRALRKAVMVAVALSLIVGTVLFVVFPRTPSPNRSLFGFGASERSGFAAGQVSLTNPRRIEPSSDEVMAVEWLGPDGKPAIVPGALRLRGQVLDRYDARSMEWRPREGIRGTIVLSEDGQWRSLAGSPVDERVNTFTLRVSMSGETLPVVFTAWLPIAVRSPTAQVFNLDSRTATIRVLDLESAADLLSYEIRVQPFPTSEALSAVLRPAQAAGRLPRLAVPAVAAFAEAILESAGEPGPLAETVLRQTERDRWERNMRVARLFEDELASERYRYTTDLREFRPIEGRDMIDLFLSHYRFGHCEYYASGLAALCQAAGVDARVVTGFLVGDQSPRDGVYTVRASHAHAWVEVRTGRAQWTVMDPTPPANQHGNGTGRSTMDGSFEWVFRPLEELWRREVTRFDAAAQDSLFASARMQLHELLAWAGDVLMALAQGTEVSGSFGLTAWTWVGSVILSCGLTVTIAVMMRRRRRRAKAALGLTRRDRARARSAMRDGAFYVDALDALATGGHARAAGSTPRGFQRAVGARNAAAGEAFERVVDRFYEIRFGARRPDAARRAADLALVEELRRALTHRV